MAHQVLRVNINPRLELMHIAIPIARLWGHRLCPLLAYGMQNPP